MQIAATACDGQIFGGPKARLPDLSAADVVRIDAVPRRRFLQPLNRIGYGGLRGVAAMTAV
jgi:hypothetical protein